MAESLAVYKAIAEVAGELAKRGISKDNKNQQQGYTFRGIDDVYNALAPLLHKHGLVILPRFTERTVTERQTQRGGALFYSVVKGEFDFVAVEDGSKHTVATFGEAMDSADKSTNKAMSAAYKYAAFQAFSIPTEGDNDADATTHTVAPVAAIKLDALDMAVMGCSTVDELTALYTQHKARIEAAPNKAEATALFSKRKVELQAMADNSKLTDKQRKAIMAHFKGVSREDRLKELSSFCQREVSSANDLTFDEASGYLDAVMGDQAAA